MLSTSQLTITNIQSSTMSSQVLGDDVLVKVVRSLVSEFHGEEEGEVVALAMALVSTQCLHSSSTLTLEI